MGLFVARDLRASRVNLLMNDFAAGLPSPLAFLGLSAVIAPNLGAERWSVAVLPVLHEVHASEGRTKPEMVPKTKDGVRKFMPIETAEDMVGSVRISLLLDVPGTANEHDLRELLRGRRIAGGAIENETIAVEAVTPDGYAFGKLPRGYAMVPCAPPRSALVASGDIDDLSRIADELFPAEREPGRGWLVPVAVGHRLLEDPETATKRTGTRDPDIPHVFTEPAVGIAELVSVRNSRLSGLDGEGLQALLWRWHAESDWIVGHPNYHPANHGI